MMHDLLVAIREKYAPLDGYRIVSAGRRNSKSVGPSGILTAERLRSLLFYDPISGTFTWRVSRVKVSAGDRAGKKTKDGYIHIGVDGRRYQAHRLAFLYMTGEMPEGLVDHKNLDRSDNSWDNLRAATNSQNQGNTALRQNNKSGFKGVSWHAAEGRWRAVIGIDGKKVFLGYADAPELAHEAYCAASETHFGEFARNA